MPWGWGASVGGPGGGPDGGGTCCCGPVGGSVQPCSRDHDGPSFGGGGSVDRGTVEPGAQGESEGGAGDAGVETGGGSAGPGGGGGSVGAAGGPDGAAS